MAKSDIILESDGPGSYKFRYLSPRGELFGRVKVGVEGPPDSRSVDDQEGAAKNQVLALAREFAQACEF